MSYVIGYLTLDNSYCADCNPDNSVHPIMDWEAFDRPLHCADCGEFLQNELTKDDGYEYLKQLYFERRMRDVDRWREYIECWPYMDWFFIHTWYGLMSPLGDVKDFD